jgi:hypothetical protein
MRMRTSCVLPQTSLVRVARVMVAEDVDAVPVTSADGTVLGIVTGSDIAAAVARYGEIIETRGPGGAPPYLVRWSDGHEGLYFPGVDARLTSTAATEPAGPGGADTGPAGGDVPRHIRSWTVSVDLFEEGLDTSAHAVLRTEAPEPLEAHGAAHRRAADPDVPEIGDEIAVARALRHLADRLLGTAADDIQVLEGRPVHLNDV